MKTHIALAFATALALAGPAAADEAADLYITRAADCMPCHTVPGGTPFAGGREIPTPFGNLASPNITPDPDTGIGGWTDDQFYAALHDGIGHRGEYLYPVMPFTSYTKMTRDDVLAIKRYLMTLKPVYAPARPNGLDFPFDIRSTLFVWRELFFTPGTFVPNPAHSADWNRGAYLVQGPGHCGECHSPRDILGATETARSLSGGMVGGWRAPNISAYPLAIGDKSIGDIVTFLKTGANAKLGVAFGPMSEVVHDSLGFMTADDLRAIATYLKEGPDRVPLPPAVAEGRARPPEGQHLYLQNCALCHQDHGIGISGVVPNLAGNAAIAATQPNDVIMALLNGLQGTGKYGQMPRFAGALDDRQITALTNYVRTAWGNKAAPNATPELVASLRAQSNTGVAGTEAARAFDCPSVGSAYIQAAQATAAQANFLSDTGSDSNNRIDELIASIRQGTPGISDTALTDTMNAAYCPFVANQTGLSGAQKRAKLAAFNTLLQDRLQLAGLAKGGHVYLPAPITPGVLQQVDQAAAGHTMSEQEWIAKTVAREAGAGH